MTETGPNPAEFRKGLADKLAALPRVNAHGREIRDHKPDQTVEAVDLTAHAVAAQQPAQPRMKPNPAQGASGSTAHAPIDTQPTGATPFDRIRAKAEQHDRPLNDPTIR